MLRKVLTLMAIVSVFAACEVQAAVVYEVWAGNTDYTSEPSWWEYYYNIDQQDYIKLGESNGQTATFSGNYYFYVIAAREEFLLDSVQGSTGDYYYGGLPTGNTSDWENIAGPPDDVCATVGYQSSGGTFRGFVVITNPGDWTGLTVITVQTAVEIIDSNWVGGSKGCWCVLNNWEPPIVPDNNPSQIFNVTIDSNYVGVDEVEVHLQQRRDVNELDCYGNIDLEKWTSDRVELTIYNGLTNHGELGIDEIGIRGNITNTTGATLGLRDMDIEGDLYNQAGAIMQVNQEAYVEGNLQNAGLLAVNPTGELGVDPYLQNTGQINIWGGHCGSDAILDNNSTGVITGFGVLHAEQMLRNKGAIYAFGGSLAIGSGEGHLNLINEGTLRNWPDSSLCLGMLEDVNNQDTIEVNAGGGVAFDCNLVNEPNGVIELLGGTLAATTITQKAGANFTGFGGITGDVIIEPNSITEPNSIIKLTGPTNIVGDVTIDPNATLQISDGQTLITGHTTCDGTIRLIGGTVIFQGGCDCANCNIIHNPGIDRSHSDINADGIENFEDFASFADTWLWQASWY